MKKLCVIFLTLLLFTVTVFATENNTTYTLEGGVLTVSCDGVCNGVPLTKEEWLTVEKIVFTEGVTEIGEYAFSGYFDDSKKYTSVYLPDGIQKIGKAAFSFVGALTDINLPSTLSEIDYGAFAESGLTAVTIPVGVTKISDALFFNSALETIVLPDTVTEIGQFAFEFTKLKEITLPSSLETIAPSAFANCDSLRTVVIPEGVTEIGSFAFYECNGLREIYLPASLETLEKSAFRYANPELRIYISEGNKYYCVSDDIIFSKDMKTLIRYPAYKTESSYTVPDFVENIFHEAFSRCVNLTELILPEGLKTIGGGAFSYCENLKSITVPESVESFGVVITGNGCPEFYGVGAYGVGAFWESSFEEITVLGNKVDVASDGWPFGHFYENVTVYCNHYSATDLGAKELGNDININIVYLDEDHEHVNTEEVTRESTCAAEGERILTCSVCGYVQTEALPKTEHLFKEEITEPTCYREGRKVLSCTECGKVDSEKNLSKTEHNYGEEHFTTVDCTMGRTAARTCLDCGRTTTVTMAGTDHSFGEWEVTKEATLKSGGEETRTCAVCGVTETRETAPLTLLEFVSPAIPYALGAIVFVLFALIGAAQKKREKASR